MYKHKLALLEYIQANTKTMLNQLYEDMQYISGEKRERCDLAEETIRLGRRDQRNQREATKENWRLAGVSEDIARGTRNTCSGH